MRLFLRLLLNLRFLFLLRRVRDALRRRNLRIAQGCVIDLLLRGFFLALDFLGHALLALGLHLGSGCLVTWRLGRRCGDRSELDHDHRRTWVADFIGTCEHCDREQSMGRYGHYGAGRPADKVLPAIAI
jgi:hypothetical protein